MTDSPKLFNVLTKATCTTEKRFMNDLQTLKDFYESFELNGVALVKLEYNFADALIKINTISIMKTVLHAGKIGTPNSIIDNSV